MKRFDEVSPTAGSKGSCLMSETEAGGKWWIRYVVVPLIGSGGIVAIVVALLNRPASSTETPGPAGKETKGSATASPYAPFAPLEYVDGTSQDQEMKACPKGFAVAGMNVKENKQLCRRVIAESEKDNVTSIVDARTQRAGMHACPTGMYVRGYNDERNLLLCSQDSRRPAQLADELQDAASQRHGMHVCPGAEGKSMVLTGINAGENRFLCSSVQ
jgi:hypothetical protein